MYGDLVQKGNIGTSAVILAREAVFGTKVKGQCSEVAKRGRLACESSGPGEVLPTLQ